MNLTRLTTCFGTALLLLPLSAGAGSPGDLPNMGKFHSAVRILSPIEKCDVPTVEMRRQALLQAMREAHGPLVTDGTVIVGTMDSDPEKPVFSSDFAPGKKSPQSHAYDLASITKPVATATAVMRLAEKQKRHGRDLLNEPIARHLPEIAKQYPKHPLLELKVRDLLMHRGCISEVSGSPGLWNGLDKRAALKKAASTVFQKTRPGSVDRDCYQYRDADYLLLSEIIRNNVDPSGRNPDAYEQFVKAEVLEPLGMKNSRFDIPDDGLSRSLSAGAGNAGLFAPATDIARYARMMLNHGAHNGRPFLGASSIAQMSTPQDRDIKFETALGFDTRPLSMTPDHHFSPATFGHTGSTGTSLLIDPQRKFYVAILAKRTKTDRRFSAEYNEFRKNINKLSAQLVEAVRIRDNLGIDGCTKVSEARGPKMLPSHGSSPVLERATEVWGAQ